jgi:hypothetical protein
MRFNCCTFPKITSTSFEWSKTTEKKSAASLGSSSALKVAFGQKTFDAEGLEDRGRYFSRRISYPGGDNSGVTVGRGYDMGLRSRGQIIRELTLAGMSQGDAEIFSKGAGLRGDKARVFVNQNSDFTPEMSLEVQKSLFENVTTPEMVNDIKRIFDKPDTVKAYGRPSWDSLTTAAQELVFDLRYRGDYTPTTRQRIQKLLVTQDYEGLRNVMNDTAYWRALKVPEGRIAERQKMAAEL